MSKGDNLQVHVIGADEGECVVLRLPTDDWGVVDCYASSLSDEHTNRPLQFLRSHGVERLAFVCMTHPHVDHFRGMSQLLKTFEVESFWLPHGMTGTELGQILEYEALDAIASGSRTKQDNVEELKEIFRLIKAQKMKSGAPQIPKKCGIGTPLYPIQMGSKSRVRINAISPSAGQVFRHESKLRACFDGNHNFTSPTQQSAHNLISIALSVDFGRTRVILAGDVEKSGWEDVLTQIDHSLLSCHAIKISHHGSETGYCENLWSLFASERRPISILTPFKRHRLPRNKAIEHIHQYVSRISCASLQGLHEREYSIPFSTGAPPMSRILLRDRMQLRAPSSQPVGICSFVFDDQGNCIAEEFVGDAGDILPHMVR